LAPGGQARDKDPDDDRILAGLAIAPVPLNLDGKNKALVGLGSYLVNGSGDCNGCHSNGPATEFSASRNPYFGQPKQVNPATYLGGGRDFGALVPNSPNIISRNLTPDKTGLPAGGMSFSDFFQVIQTGVDIDKVHPSCSASVTSNCIPAPFNGALLQIMPWPIFQSMSAEDLRAIYEYLSAIPCLEGAPANRRVAASSVGPGPLGSGQTRVPGDKAIEFRPRHTPGGMPCRWRHLLALRPIGTQCERSTICKMRKWGDQVC
jgi:hypothetical protein